MCEHLNKFGPLLGRILLSVIFILAGIGKITDFSGTAAFMASKDLPLVNLLLVLTIIVELGGGLLILIGWQARWAAAALFLFTGIVTLIFHPFWSFEGAEAVQNFQGFFKNLAIMGGLMYVLVHGSGPLSLGGNFGLSKCDRKNG
jgi:Predicted membrane protein